MTKRILVIEDEPQMLLGLRDNLELEGYEVVTASDGEDGLAKAISTAPDLVILDITLPRKNGFEVCRELRARANPTPVVMLTARSQETEKVLGLELGADDYVTKPFSIRELALRVRALLKRGTAPSERERRVLQAGPILLDLESHKVEVREEVVVLTITEFRLLADLVRARGRVRTREALLSEVWGYDSEVLSRTVDTHVRRLRAKLGPAADWLRTIRGVGYRLDEPNAD